MNVLETLRDAKEKALAEYKTKEKELAALRSELIKLGAITPEAVPTGPTKNTGRKSGGRAPQVKTEDKIERIKAALKGGKSMTEKELRDAIKVSGFLGKVLDGMKKDLSTTGGGSPKDPTKYALK